MVDVVEDDRPALGGDPAGEAAADWDAHPASTSSSRPTAALATSSSFDSSRSRIAAVSTSRMSLILIEELADEVLEAELGERRVHHALHAFEASPAAAFRVEEPGVLDRQRDAVGDGFEQLDLVVRELPERQRSNVEHPEHVVREDERHPGEALDPLLAEQWVQDVGVVDVVEHDRAPFRGDPAGEPAADRDPDALFDLFLDSDCGAGDQVVAQLVAEQDRHRVGLERLSNARQQLGEQVVQNQMRQRCIGDELKTSKPLGIAGVGHSPKDTWRSDRCQFAPFCRAYRRCYAQAMSRSVIVSTARTPFGKLGGGLAGYEAPELGAIAIKGRARAGGARRRREVEYVIMGEVLQAGVGQAPARQAAIGAGIPKEVGADTVNKVCASSIRAVEIADTMIRAGDHEVIVTGGMESMSNAPYLLEEGAASATGSATAR